MHKTIFFLPKRHASWPSVQFMIVLAHMANNRRVNDWSHLHKIICYQSVEQRFISILEFLQYVPFSEIVVTDPTNMLFFS